MEDLVIKSLFNKIYKGKTVLLTGHTGFKGSWLSYWLEQMGAKVVGFSMDAPTIPNHYSLLNTNIESIIADINDFDKLSQVMNKYRPDIVFHLAAQSLVRKSYLNPFETYETNVMGTLKVFEASKNANVKAIINITSDKVYENQERIQGYKETELLGGYDPYSASKACADILASSYQRSFLNKNNYKNTHNTLIATCRAGNVIGGGDWAEDRLFTDIVRSIEKNKILKIRNPYSTRPWQHVLEPLSGYLLLGQKLLEGKVKYAEAWNFGPSEEENISVEELVTKIKYYWDDLKYEIEVDKNNFHEAMYLNLDSTKAHRILKWKPIWDSIDTFKKTTLWYKEYYQKKEIQTHENLLSYINSAISQGQVWTK